MEGGLSISEEFGSGGLCINLKITVQTRYWSRFNQVNFDLCHGADHGSEEVRVCANAPTSDMHQIVAGASESEARLAMLAVTGC